MIDDSSSDLLYQKRVTQWSRIDRQSYLREDRVRTILQFGSRLGAENLLDVGCGTGELTLLMKEALRASEAFGIDVGQNAVTEANRKGIQAFATDIDCGPIPFPDNQFDFVLCGEVIEHVYDTDHLLEEIYRVLKPSKYCIITTPNLASWVNRFALLLGYQPYGTSPSIKYGLAGMLFFKPEGGEGQHLRVMTLKALKILVEKNGFRVITVKGSRQVGYTLPRFIYPLYRAFSALAQKFPSLADDLIILMQRT